MPLVTYGRPYPDTGEAFEAQAPAPAGYPMVRAVGDTPAEAASAFEAEWAGQPGRNESDPCEFVRVVRVRAELALVLEDGAEQWRASTGMPDGSRFVVTAGTRAEAEDQFAEAWNASQGTDHEPEAFAFDRVG